jgi:hypothetical protein
MKNKFTFTDFCIYMFVFQVLLFVFNTVIEYNTVFQDYKQCQTQSGQLVRVYGERWQCSKGLEKITLPQKY